VIDAAGAIYVIGGSSGDTVYNDVWASTDGGARPDYVGGGRLGYEGGPKGYYLVLRGCCGTPGVLS
jgi:hypothetical protein